MRQSFCSRGERGRPPRGRPTPLESDQPPLPKEHGTRCVSDNTDPLVLTSSGSHCSGRYTSHWNAFLFIMQPSLCSLDISQPLMYLWFSYKFLVHLSCHTCFTMSSCYNVVRPYILVRPITPYMAQTLDKKIDEAADNPKKE